MRVHDLQHTFGRRLRAARVSVEDRQDLLGHESARITDHYSGAETGNLIEAANSGAGRRPAKAPEAIQGQRHSSAGGFKFWIFRVLLGGRVGIEPTIT